MRQRRDVVGDQRRVLRCIREHGPLSMKEVATKLDIGFNRISGRGTELKQQGRLRPTGEVRFGSKVLEVNGCN